MCWKETVLNRKTASKYFDKNYCCLSKQLIDKVKPLCDKNMVNKNSHIVYLRQHESSSWFCNNFMFTSSVAFRYPAYFSYNVWSNFFKVCRKFSLFGSSLLNVQEKLLLGFSSRDFFLSRKNIFVVVFLVFSYFRYHVLNIMFSANQTFWIIVGYFGEIFFKNKCIRYNDN